MKNKKNIYLTLSILTVIIVLSCKSNNKTISSETKETTAPVITENSIVEANNKFNFDFLQEITLTENTNTFFSPYSILTALAITLEGCNGNTAAEIRETFHLPDASEFAQSFKTLDDSINNQDTSYTLKTANGIWPEKTYTFTPRYFKRVTKYYNAKLSSLDYTNEAEKSRNTINEFIEENTESKIKNLFPEGSITNLTRLVIANAIYFNADWQTEFNDKLTGKKTFYKPGNKKTETNMMYMSPDSEFEYYENEKMQVLNLPYKNEKLYFSIILPKEILTNKELGKFISYNDYTSLQSNMQYKKINEIILPKFEFDYGKSLTDTLKNMGIKDAFNSENANLSMMTDTDDLYISDIIHKAFVKVDEKGTEAAAATGVVVATRSMVNPDRLIFNANRPFIFMVIDKKNNHILFTGIFTEP